MAATRGSDTINNAKVRKKQFFQDQREIIPNLAAFFTDGSERTWMKEAACRGADTNLWFPEKGHQAQYKQAVAVCNRCPVRIECAEYGATEQYGIWGGMNLKQRQAWSKEHFNAG